MANFVKLMEFIKAQFIWIYTNIEYNKNLTKSNLTFCREIISWLKVCKNNIHTLINCHESASFWLRIERKINICIMSISKMANDQKWSSATVEVNFLMREDCEFKKIRKKESSQRENS